MVAMAPFGTEPVPPLVSALVATTILVALSLVGYRLLPTRLRPRRAVLAVPFASSLGMTAVGLSTWVIGAVVGTSAAVIAAVALAVWSLSAARIWLRDVRRLARRIIALLRRNPVLALFGLATVALAVPHLLLPVVDSDGLRYHLALPKLFLLEGRVFFYPWDVHSAFPQTVEAVYLLGLRAAGGEVAKFLHFGAFLGCLAVLTLGVHRDRTTRRAAVCAPWFFAASPAVLAAAGAAFIDLFVVFHIAVAALLTRFRANPWLIGCALAGASCSKWSSAPAVAGLAVLVWWQSRFKWRVLAALLVPIVIAVLPYLVRNLASTGDPVFPMGVGLLKGEVPGIAEDRHAYVTQVHREIPGPLGIPWGASVGEVQRDEVAGWHLLLGLLALPLALRQGTTGRIAFAVVIPYLVVGLAFHPSVRLAMPLLWVLAALSAGAVTRATGRLSPAVGALLVTPALLTSWGILTSHGRPLDRLMGRISAEESIRLTVPGRAAAEIVNQQPTGGRVMALDFPAPYYFNRPWIAEGILNDPPLLIWLRQGADADSIFDRLQDLDVRLLVVTPGYGGGSPISLVAVGETPIQRGIMADLRGRLELIGTRDRVDVFRVPSTGQPQPPPR